MQNSSPIYDEVATPEFVKEVHHAIFAAAACPLTEEEMVQLTRQALEAFTAVYRGEDLGSKN